MDATVRTREGWYRRRTEMELRKQRSSPNGHPRWRYWPLFKVLIAVFGVGLRVLGLYRRGLRNALDLRLTRIELSFEALPPAFDGFTILQLTDLHFDALPETTAAARALIDQVEADLCVLTGDYRFRVSGPYQQILPDMRDLIAGVRSRHGTCAVLGNHDCADMAAAFEALGLTVLINESMSLERAGEQIHITGTDDVHYFYTEAARAALAGAPEGFRIALVHSPELAGIASDHGFQLYLTGHTHGGQICLPGGRPILTHLTQHRRYARGLWRHGAMQGYTSTGIGVSALPVRYNNRGEVALITLRRAPAKP